MRCVAAAAMFLVAAVPAATQSLQPFIPVGVLVDGEQAITDRQELLALAKRRFNVIGARDPAGDLRLTALTLVSAASADKPPILPATGVVTVDASVGARKLRLYAWQAVATGARGVVFDSLDALARDGNALDAASNFADNVTRNAALFAPLRPRKSQTDVVVDPPTAAVVPYVLESSVAIVLIVCNQADETHRVMLKFSSNIPEAIWQNMETGAAVNFVASPDGPIYLRTFTPFDLVVLMIRKQFK
jgi:hypothetical protein